MVRRVAVLICIVGERNMVAGHNGSRRAGVGSTDDLEVDGSPNVLSSRASFVVVPFASMIENVCCPYSTN